MYGHICICTNYTQLQEFPYFGTNGTPYTKHPAADIWIAFGSGKNFTYMHINAIYHALGKDKSMSLPIFHCFTGCDTTSAFLGKGKRSAWEAWNSYPEVTAAFIYMSTHPHTPLTKESQHFRYLKRFTVVLYDKTSSLGSVDEARRELFCQKNRTMESIPPAQDALLQHCKRVAYQAGIWTTSKLVQQQTPTLEGHGWTFDSNSLSWLPVWSTLPLSSKACSEPARMSKAVVQGVHARRRNGNAQNYAAVNVKNSQLHELPIIKTVLNHLTQFIMFTTISLCEVKILIFAIFALHLFLTNFASSRC